MTSRADLQHAAELLDRLTPQATPGPWRDSTVDGNRYAALVSDTCIRRCDEYAARWPADSPWRDRHPHDGYGGCLIAESQTSHDRRLMATMRNVADDLADLLRAVAQEDPLQVGHLARRMADAVLATHPAVTLRVPPTGQLDSLVDHPRQMLQQHPGRRLRQPDRHTLGPITEHRDPDPRGHRPPVIRLQHVGLDRDRVAVDHRITRPERNPLRVCRHAHIVSPTSDTFPPKRVTPR